MVEAATRIRRTYLAVVLGNTLAASLIWGINTLFLLDAGLTATAAFAANAFFTAGMVLFEVPTGLVADRRGRRTSYLLGTVVLAATTVAYVALWYLEAEFWAWAVVSMLIGLGFTFFSGALEAWLVDALTHVGAAASIEHVLGRAQVVGGVAMLAGTVGGGVLAQTTSIAVPYLVRAALLLVLCAVAARLLHDEGFIPDRTASTRAAWTTLLAAAVAHGPGRPAVRWLMVSGAFLSGVGIYAFYALQPYLLALYGDGGAYAVAALAAALLACAQVAGGLLAPWVRRRVRRRTTLLLGAALLGALLLAAVGTTVSFGAALVLLVAMGLVQATAAPARQAYLNALVPSAQRATVLSIDSLVANGGGVVVQPLLGRTADLWGFGTSYVAGAAVQMLAIPFLVLSRRTCGDADGADTPENSHPEDRGRTYLR